MRKTKKNNKKILKKHVIMFFVSFTVVVFVANYIVKVFDRAFKNYAYVETKAFISNIINNTITSDYISKFEKANEPILMEVKNNNGDIIAVDVNKMVVNNFLAATIQRLENNLIDVESGNFSNVKMPYGITTSRYKKLKKGIIVEIPSGSIFGESVLSNVGPKIPIKMSLLGDIVGNIDLKVRDYGINNTLIEVYLKIVINERIILPMSFEKVSMSYKVLVDTKLINGKIPDYYLNSDLYTKNI